MQSNLNTAIEITEIIEKSDGYLQFAFAVEVLARKWTLSILSNLTTKEKVRFNELRRLMTGISSTVLSDRLLELEREGLISKKVYPEIPLKVEYRLTARAMELKIILEDLGRWALHWKSPNGSASTLLQ
jgi:DNA-binding HxlR family transcriptional regulator